MPKMLKLKDHSAKGFTIVETLLVLAIAALILVIILIAVPELQRAARNHGRHDDAYHIIAAVDDYYSKNDKMPSVICTAGPGQSVYLADGTGTDLPVTFDPTFYNLTPANGTLSGGVCTGSGVGGTSGGWVHIIPYAGGGPGSIHTFPGGLPSDDTLDHIVINVGGSCGGGTFANQGQPNAKYTDTLSSSIQFFVAILIEDGGGNWSVQCIQG